MNSTYYFLALYGTRRLITVFNVFVVVVAVVFAAAAISFHRLGTVQ
jgi:hypothetical protein